MRIPRLALAGWLVSLPLLAPGPAPAAGPSVAVDLAAVSPTSPRLLRAYGSVGDGTSGLPVAGGFDVDADGHADMAFGAMFADPFGRTNAGEVFLILGDGTLGTSIDTSQSHPNVLRIAGAGTLEMAGSELWMADVTADGVGDLLIARQNYRASAPDRPGAGALTILVGGPEVATFAASGQVLDLASPPPSLTLFTLVGAATTDRLGIWMRTGDVTGDGFADLVVAADQEAASGDTHSGAAYVVRGGPHLEVNATVDLAGFGSTILQGHILRIVPPVGSSHNHLGATCQIADLDGDGRAEVLLAAALNRAGATVVADGAPANSAHATGRRLPGGRLYIVWADNIPGGATWAPGLTLDLGAPTGTLSILDGGAPSEYFGEEILGGLDYDDDGDADLFVGDITGDWSGQSRGAAGSGHVFYDAANLAGLQFDLDNVPVGVVTTTFLGGASGAIAADTALHGDFDGDGLDDLSFSSPHAAPFGRTNAGTLHVFFGQAGGWPTLVDLQPGSLPSPGDLRIAEVYGAHGRSGSDQGDTLSYSAQAGDIDGDGRTDLVTNEMAGNGVAPGTEDVGNLIVLSGLLVQGLPPLAVPPWATGGLGALLVAVGVGWLRLRPGRRRGAEAGRQGALRER